MTERNTSEQDRILGRIRKMMALANDAAASQGERDNALRMAHATLAKYGLSMAQAEESGQQPQEKRGVEDCQTRNQPWARHVAHATAKLFFCRYYFSKPRDAAGIRQGKIVHNFVGRESNATTAKEMTDFVVNSIMKEANREWKKQANPGPWWTSFCKGAADQVSARCDQLRAEAEKQSQEDSTGRELVLASYYANEQSANALFIAEVLKLNLRTSKAREKGAGDWYNAGKQFGSTISLNRQVGATTSTVKRLG